MIIAFQILIVLLLFAACWQIYLNNQDFDYPEPVKPETREVDENLVWLYTHSPAGHIKSIKLTDTKTNKEINAVIEYVGDEKKLIAYDKSGNEIKDLKFDKVPNINFEFVRKAMQRYIKGTQKINITDKKRIRVLGPDEMEVIIGGNKKKFFGFASPTLPMGEQPNNH